MSPPAYPAETSIGGGSLLIAWQLKDKNVLIVGGGEVASQRIESILVADAYITLLSPRKGLHPKTKLLIDSFPQRIKFFDRRFTGPAELHKMDMVLTSIDDSKRSREVVELCRAAKIPVNAADIPDCCDFYFGAQIRDGPLQIMISTNGNGPRMASLVRTKIQKGLTGLEGNAIKKVGTLREKLKERAPGVGGLEGKRRMKWMTQFCNTWPMEDLSLINDAIIAQILDLGWDQDRVPTPEEIFGRRSIFSVTSRFLSSPSKSLSCEASTTPDSNTHTRLFKDTLAPPAAGFVAGALFVAAIMLLRGR